MHDVSLQAWVGRQEQDRSLIEPLRAQALQAALGEEGPRLETGDALPPLWHWLYFWELVAPPGLGPEGHPKLGGFLPPVPLPRRMWAGSRLVFPRPLLLGSGVTRNSSIKSVVEKEGRQGPLVFVTVAHRIEDAKGLVIEEEHDIVYRSAPKPDPDGSAPPVKPPPRPAPDRADWQFSCRPDVILLFRYSALTFNAHRIHFDRDFCRAQEGYPGLVVHGPLMATLMAGLARTHCPERRVTEFSFRGVSPVFEGETLTVAGALGDDGRTAELWATDGEGALAMQGSLSLADETGEKT